MPKPKAETLTPASRLETKQDLMHFFELLMENLEKERKDIHPINLKCQFVRGSYPHNPVDIFYAIQVIDKRTEEIVIIAPLTDELHQILLADVETLQTLMPELKLTSSTVH